MARGLLVLLAALFVRAALATLQAWAEEVAGSCDVSEQTFLLQIGLHPPRSPEKLEPLAPLAHHWPHTRGRTGQLCLTPYPMVTSSGNLSDSLLWHKDFGSSDAVWGALIDHESNLYAACGSGIWKMSPTGEVLWRHHKPAFYSVLVGNAVCSQTNVGGRSIYCLSQKTGEEFWHRKVFPTAGFGGNQIEAHNGVILVAAGEFVIEMLTDMTGKANDRVVAVNASTGDELWQFKADCGLWMFMGLFPDNDTTLFQDQCGGVYRLGLFNGTLLWYTPGAPGTLSDGAAILGPDGSAYGCSMPPGAKLLDNNDPLYPGVLRKFRLSDGKVLWSAETPYPCTNIPAVTADGRTVVVAPGAIPAVDGPFYYKRKEIQSLPKHQQLALHEEYDRMMRNNTLRAFFNMKDLTGAIMGFDALTGEVQWRHEVPPSGSITAAGDQERNWKAFIEGGLEEADMSTFDKADQTLPHCGPPHWTSPTLDLQGNIYIGDSVGEVRVYNPKTGREIDFHTGDGFLPSGPSSAPGIMVFATCQTLYVFKAEGGAPARDEATQFHEQPSASKPSAQWLASFLQHRERSTGSVPVNYAFTLIHKMPHVDRPFTQGLEFTADGQLLETSGDYPEGVGSFVRLLDPDTGREIKRTSMASPCFVEGISERNGRWFASTYSDGLALELGADLALLKTHRYPHLGWGLARSADGSAFLATNGSEHVMTLDPASFRATGSKVATCLGKRVRGLNELEMVDDFLGHGPTLLGNVMATRLVLALDPSAMSCVGVLELQGSKLERVQGGEISGYHVANGVAYHRGRGTLFATGKNWHSIYELRVEEAPERTDAVQALAVHLLEAEAAP